MSGINNGFIICHGHCGTAQPQTITYPIAFKTWANVVCQIIHGKVGWSNICIDTYSKTAFTCWAFHEGKTYGGEQFMYVIVGF